jgi:hypothetical protein
MASAQQNLTQRHRGAEKKFSLHFSAPLRLCVRISSACLVAWLTIATPARAQTEDSPPEPDKALREKWQQVYQKIAGSIDMRRGKVALTLEPAPLLFYTNPVRLNQQHGAIYLWTERGRPVVLGSIWSALNRNDASVRLVTHEFHSLAATPDVTASKNGAKLWAAGEAGIAWQALEGAPAPAATRPARLIQMRQLARRLSARITAEEASDLRLMTNPLYRYAESAIGHDGAVFAFSLATDPEVIVLVEADLAANNPAYKAAFARFGNLAMEVKDGEHVVWTCDRGTPGRSEGKYYLRWRAEEMPAQPVVLNPEP